MALALLDLSKPHIEIVNITSLNDSTTRVIWKVNGCHTINEARARFFQATSSEEETITYIKESDHKYPASGTCNYDSQQSTFTLDLPSDAQFTLEAVVDQDFAKAKDPTRVDPPEMSGRPQLHLSKMRIEDTYRAKSRSGKTLEGRRVLQASKRDYVKEKQSG